MNTLLIIDLQEGFRFPETEKLAQLLHDNLSNFEGKIVFACFKDETGSRFETNLKWAIFQDAQKQEILSELKDAAADKNIIIHTGYGIKIPQDLIQPKTKLFLAGIYTDVCILHTALELFDLGVDVYVIEDWCASPNNHFNNQIHFCALETIRHAIGKDKVINSTDLKTIL